MKCLMLSYYIKLICIDATRRKKLVIIAVAETMTKGSYSDAHVHTDCGSSFK